MPEIAATTKNNDPAANNFAKLFYLIAGRERFALFLRHALFAGALAESFGLSLVHRVLNGYSQRFGKICIRLVRQIIERATEAPVQLAQQSQQLLRQLERLSSRAPSQGLSITCRFELGFDPSFDTGRRTITGITMNGRPFGRMKRRA
ncbi:MAG: hypothetical protein QF603_19530 [Alphaproteobacteria bacterium]|nr:hypothetical protein [Alphaproteobacteria bacterium]